MQIGIAIPQYGTHARGDAVAWFSRAAEEAGFDTLWASDRSLTPVNPSDTYPGSPPGELYPPEYTTFMDPLTVLSAAATATSRVRLGTSTLNALWYPPLLLGRALTSLDALSGGRLEPGFGLGWLRDEYTSVNVSWRGRGARLEETLDVLEAMWRDDPFEHHGDLWDIPLSHLHLRPVQDPHPPVFLGGFGPATMERVGRRAAGWLPAGLPLPTLAELWEMARRAAGENGRDPDALRRHLRFNHQPGSTVDQIAGDLEEARKAGLESVFVDLQQCVREPEEALELGGKVLGVLRGEATQHG